MRPVTDANAVPTKKNARYDGLLHTRVMHHVHQASAPASPARLADWREWRSRCLRRDLPTGATAVPGASGIPRRDWRIGCISATGRQACLGPTGVAGASGATCRLARLAYPARVAYPGVTGGSGVSAPLADWRTRRVIAPPCNRTCVPLPSLAAIVPCPAVSSSSGIHPHPTVSGAASRTPGRIR